MKRKLGIILILLTIIFSTVGITSLINDRDNIKGPISAEGLSTTIIDKPTDGSTPIEHNSQENVAILAGMIAKNNYTAVTKGKVMADVAIMKYTQYVDNIRTVKDKRAFVEAISSSSMKSVGIQKYFFLDEKKVLTREPKKIDGANTTWDSGEPQVLSNTQHKNIYGWLPNQLSAYIICDETVLEYGELTKTENGLNSITIKLDANKAPANYQYEVKAYAGADEFPVFHEVIMTFNFDNNWILKNIDRKEVYDIKIPVIGSLKCEGTLNEVFSYDNITLKDQDYFESYKHLTPSESDEIVKPELKPMDYLMYAFGDYINGKVGYFDLALDINGHKIDGKVLLDIKNMRFGFDSEKIKVLYEDDIVYLDTFGLKTKLSIEEFKKLIGSKAKALDFNTIIDALNEATITKDGNNVYMHSEINILDNIINLDFRFTNENDVIALGDIKASAKFKDLNLSAAVTPGTEFTPNINKEEHQDLQNLDFLVEDIIKIIKNKQITLKGALKLKEQLINFDLFVKFEAKVEVKGSIVIPKGNKNTTINLTYKDDYFIIEYNKLKIKGTLEEIKKLITEFMPKNNSLDINQVLDFIFNFDPKKYINNISINKGVLVLDLNLSKIDPSLQNTLININNTDEGFTISSNLIDLSLSLDTRYNDTIIKHPTGLIIPLSKLFPQIKKALELVNNNYINISATTTISVFGLDVDADANVNVSLKDLMLDGNVNINILNKLFNIRSRLLNNELIIDFGNNFNIKLPLTSSKSIDIESILNLITDISVVDNSLVITINNKIHLTIDENLNITLSNLDFSGITIKNTTLTLSTGSKFTVDNTVTSSTLGKTEILNLVNMFNNLKQIFTDNFSIKGSFNGIDINILASKDLKASGSITVMNQVIKFYFDNELYLEVGNIRVKSSITTLMNLINKFINGNSINDLLAGLDLNNIIKTLTVSDNSITVNGYTFTINNGINYAGTKLKFDVTNSVEAISKPQAVEKYIDLKILTPFIDSVVALVKANYMNINVNSNINALGQNITIDGTLKFSIKDLMLDGNINVNLLNKVLNVRTRLVNNELIVDLGNNANIKLALADLGLNTNGIDLSKIVALITNFRMNSDMLEITIMNNIVINIDKSLNITLNDMSMNGIALSGTEISISNGSEFTVDNTVTSSTLGKTEILNLVNMFNNLKQTFTDNFSIKGSFNGIDINILASKDLKASGSITVMNQVIKFYFDNELYLEVGNIKVKSSITTLMNLINKFTNGNSINDLLAGLDLNNIIKTLTVSDNSITVNGYTFTINNGINYTGTKLKFDVTNCVEDISKPQAVEKYIDLKILTPFIDSFIPLINNNYLNITLGGNINALGQNITIDGTLKFSIKDLMLDGNINVNLLNKVLNIRTRLVNNELIVDLGNNANIRLNVDLTELLSMITKFEVVNSNIVIGVLNNINIRIDNKLNVTIDDINISCISVIGVHANIGTGESFTTDNKVTSSTIGEAEIKHITNMINRLITNFTDNFEIKGSFNDIDINLIVSKDLKASGTINVMNQIINTNFDKELFVSLGNIKVKSNITNLLNLVDKFTNGNGIESLIENLDLNNLIKVLKITDDSIIVDGYTVNITDHITLTSNILNLTVSNTTKVPETLTNTTDYIDLVSLTPFIDSILANLNNNYFGITLSSVLNLNGTNLNVNVNIITDLKGLNVVLNISDSTTNVCINISLINNILKIKLNNNEVELTTNELRQLIKNNIGPNINIENLITEFKLIDNNLVIKTSLLNGLTLTMRPEGSSLRLSISDISYNNISLSNINLITDNNKKEVSDLTLNNPLRFNEVNSIKNIINKIITLVNSNVELNGGLRVTINKNDYFDVKYNIIGNLSNKVLKGSILVTTSMNIKHNIAIQYENNYIVAKYGNNTFRLSINEITQLISRVSQMFNLGVSLPSNINLNFLSLINKLELTYDNKLNITLDTIKISVDESLNVNVSDINIQNVTVSNINLNVNNTDVITLDKYDSYLDYNNVNQILDHIDSLIKYLQNEYLSINLSGRITDNTAVYELSGKVYLKLDKTNNLNLHLQISLTTNTVNYNSHYFDVVIINNYFYINYKNNPQSENSLKLKANINDLRELINTISELINFDFSGLESELGQINKNTILAALAKVDFEALLGAIMVNDNSLTLSVDKRLLGAPSNLEITLHKNGNKFTGIEVSGIKFNTCLIETNITSSDEILGIEIPSDEATYYDLSILNPLVKTLFNTVKLTDYNITAKVNVKASIIGIPINMSLDIRANIERIKESNVPVFHIQIGNIPVILGVNNDVKYIGGDTNGGDSRTLDMYLVDGKVYMHRYEYIGRFLADPRLYQRKLAVSLGDFASNIVDYLLGFGFGFYGNVMNAITGSMGTSDPKPIDFTNVIKAFNYDSSRYNFTINLCELTHNDKMDTFDISLGTSNVKGVEYLSSIHFNVHMPLASGVNIDISSDNVTLNNITEQVDVSNVYEYKNNYIFEQNVQYEHYGLKGDVWAPVNNDITIYFEENGGPLVNDISGKPNESFVLPTYDGPQLINGEYYRFDGWYKDRELQVKETETKFGARGYSLYAKWTKLGNYKVNVHTGIYNKDYNLTVLESTEFKLNDVEQYIVVDGTFYEFKGFYLDSNFNTKLESYVMPNHNLDIYLSFEKLSSKTLTVYTPLGAKEYTVPHGRTLYIKDLNLPTNFGGREHYLLGCSLNNDNKYITEIFMDNNYTLYSHYEQMFNLKYQDQVSNNIDMWVRGNYKFTVPTLTGEGRTHNTNNVIVTINGERKSLNGYNMYGVKAGDVINITSDYTLIANYKNVYEVGIYELVSKSFWQGVKEWLCETILVEEGSLNMEFNGRKHYASYTYTSGFYYEIILPEFIPTINVTSNMKIFWTVHKQEV